MSNRQAQPGSSSGSSVGSYETTSDGNGDKANILLVDDRPENLIALEAILSDLGQNLVLAHRGEDALRHTLHTDFAVILLDVMMPGMSGVETATLIRQRPRTRAVPIVFLTAYQGSELDLLNSYEAGGIDYLVKPLNPDVLRAKVSLFLEIWRQRRDIERQTDLLRRSMLTIIEERKRTAEERRRRQELEEFAHIASHDLKEPLRAVHTFSQLLLRDFAHEISPAAREYFNHVVEGASRINRLVDDLIEYAQVRAELVNVSQVDLGDTVKEALRRLAPQIARSNAKVHYDELPCLTGNSRQFTLLFEHLIDNALKFRGPAEPEIFIHASQGSGQWLLEIRDNGIGFEQRFADRVFLLFKRLHLRGDYEGTGFGLALCKRIVERHGGRIWAESEPGHGSTFFIALPSQVCEKPAFADGQRSRLD